MTDAGRICMLPQGDYDSTATYEFLDIVYYSTTGSSYIAKQSTTGNAPTDTTYWQLLCEGTIEADTALDITSENAVQNKVITEAINNITSSIVVDEVPTSLSTFPVSSGGTYTALTEKLDADMIWTGTEAEYESASSSIEDGALVGITDDEDENVDLSENPVTFTSLDSTSDLEYTAPDVMTTGENLSSLFGKISRVFKNVRYLFSLIGSTDISSIGTGTITNALSTLDGSIGSTDISDVGDTVTDAVYNLNTNLTYKLIGSATGTTAIDISSDTSKEYWVEVRNGSNTAIRFPFTIPRIALSSTVVQYRSGFANNGNDCMVIIAASLSYITLLALQGYSTDGSWDTTSTSYINVYGR